MRPVRRNNIITNSRPLLESLMPGRPTRITARIAFFLCGATSLFTAAPYVMLRGSELPVQSEWIIFAAALGLVGLCSVTLAFLPRSWIAKACGKDRDDPRIFAMPLKMLAAFAAGFYVLALVAYFAPHNWDLNTQLMFALCPMYFVRMTIDPSPTTVFFLLAPMNAGAYGALGATLGCAWLVFRRRTSS
jgi:hypothetical protein